MTPEERETLNETLKKSAALAAEKNREARLAEEAMRQQMFKTMVALEKMAAAVTDYLTADRQPTEQLGETVEPDKQTSMLIEDDVVIKGALTVEGDVTVQGCTTTIDSEVRPGELKEMGKVVAKHHRALGLLATFSMMKDKPVFGLEPARAIADLLGMKACRNCVGTGWAARDETCDECEGSGYIKA